MAQRLRGEAGSHGLRAHASCPIRHWPRPRPIEPAVRPCAGGEVPNPAIRMKPLQSLAAFFLRPFRDPGEGIVNIVPQRKLREGAGRVGRLKAAELAEEVDQAAVVLLRNIHKRLPRPIALRISEIELNHFASSRPAELQVKSLG